MTTIAPSVLAADFRNLEREINKINQSSAEWIHFDVMDGVFVPNISFGFPVLEAVRSLTTKFIDVHLMIQDASKYFAEFKKAGADHITFHFEQNDHIEADIDQLRALNLSVGLVINPDTPVSSILPFLSKIDVLLIMSVFPGFGGQKFIEGTYEKIAIAKSFIEKNQLKTKIQIDGGVSIENAQKLVESGADILVSGSALFKSEDFSEYVEKLKR